MVFTFRNRAPCPASARAGLALSALLALAMLPREAGAGWVRCDSVGAGSDAGGAAARIRIENGTAAPLTLYRVDARGTAARRATLQPGAAPEVAGHIGELWFVAGGDGACRNALRIERAGETFLLYD